MTYDQWKCTPPDDYPYDPDPREDCNHDEYEIRWDGFAHCDYCGANWWASDAEIEAERQRHEDYDRWCRWEERRQRWRDRWINWVLVPTLPLRMWVQGVVWKLFPSRRRVNRFLSIHDEIPF